MVAHAVKLRYLLQLFGMQCSRWSKISRSFLAIMDNLVAQSEAQRRLC